MHLCVDDLIDTKPLCIQTNADSLSVGPYGTSWREILIKVQWENIAVKSCLQKVVYIVSASINRLNDQLPRDYNKNFVFGTDWIKLTGILQV